MAGTKPAGIGFEVRNPVPWHPYRNPHVTTGLAPLFIPSLAPSLRLVTVYRDF
jgi:hypothetical protein